MHEDSLPWKTQLAKSADPRQHPINMTLWDSILFSSSRTYTWVFLHYLKYKSTRAPTSLRPIWSASLGHWARSLHTTHSWPLGMGREVCRSPSKLKGLKGNLCACGNPLYSRRRRRGEAHLKTGQHSPSMAMLGFSYLIIFETSCRSKHKLLSHKTNKAPSRGIWKILSRHFLLWAWFTFVSRSDCSGQTLHPWLCLHLLLASLYLQKVPSCPNNTVLSRQGTWISFGQTTALHFIAAALTPNQVFCVNTQKVNRNSFVYPGLFQGFRLLRDNFSPPCNSQHHLIYFSKPFDSAGWDRMDHMGRQRYVC